MKSIILRISAYKEKDAVVTAINEEGIITFIVKGLLSSKSKFLALNNPLTIAELRLSEEGKYKHPILKDVNIIASPLNLMGRLRDLSLIMLLADLVNVTLQDEEKLVVFQYLLSSLEDIYKNYKINENILFFLFKVLTVTGYEFSVDNCVTCNSKESIVTFSFEKGGFICKNCKEINDKILTSSTTLLKLRYLIKTKTNKFDFEPIADDEFENILKDLIVFFEDNFGVDIKNKQLLF